MAPLQIKDMQVYEAKRMLHKFRGLVKAKLQVTSAHSDPQIIIQAALEVGYTFFEFDLQMDKSMPLKQTYSDTMIKLTANSTFTQDAYICIRHTGRTLRTTRSL
jgi:hypothetical protein